MDQAAPGVPEGGSEDPRGKSHRPTRILRVLKNSNTFTEGGRGIRSLRGSRRSMGSSYLKSWGFVNELQGESDMCEKQSKDEKCTLTLPYFL